MHSHTLHTHQALLVLEFKYLVQVYYMTDLEFKVFSMAQISSSISEVRGRFQTHCTRSNHLHK